MKRSPSTKIVSRSSSYQSKKPKTAVFRPLRSLKYNAPNSITRVASTYLTWTTTGFNIGVNNYQGIFLTFSPQNVYIWGSTTNFLQVPIPNASEIPALYDTLRIDKVEVSFSTNIDNQTSGSAGALQIPRFIVANDFNDGTSGTTTSQVQQQDGARMFTAQGPYPYKHTCYPKFQRIVYYSAAVSSYEPARGFVNSDVDIGHYGVRLAFDSPSNSVILAGILNIHTKFYFTMKNVK